MTDRELLEAAAKAAGLDVRWIAECQDYYEHRPHMLPGYWDKWNPLTNDDDALRLAVRLRIDVLFDGRDSPNAHVETVANEPAQETQPWAHEPLKFEENAATRRAIVRAAAEIGRQMP